MVDEIDIWRTAKLFLDRHGEAAGVRAAQRADELLARGDMDGRAVWLCIVKAIENLQEREPGDVVH